ncbi:MAG TPA: branched-chain amino acid ABC transporter permease [Xanthobacteraceae bacterium]|nr:branched-chain amino acid ABC transporter permease [Xanthobacteraceae bacterium]
MSTTLLAVQILNGLQLGVLLFLVAAGLTLVFGVMDFINLAHGVQYMLGAYLAVTFYALTGSFLSTLILALAAALAFGLVLEFAVFRHLYDRDHLDHVIATFGIILFLNHGVKLVWGAAPLSLPMPEVFSGSVRLAEGLVYPVWRLVIIAAGLSIAALLNVLVAHTRIGMLVRAGATNAAMVSALGVNIRRLFMTVFGFGAMLAGFAGIMIAPILSVEPGMGDNILILAFVVIVIGGIGSIRGAFSAALLIGLVDTLGRSFSVDILRLVMGPSPARTVGPAVASMLIYLLMAVVLYVRPTGLFPAKGR